MQTVGIKTAQNIDIDYNVAGLGERIVARIIDYCLYLAIYLLYTWIFHNVTSAPVLWEYTLPEILFFTFYVFYDFLAELFFNGQSLGKFIMKIKVVSLDGGRPRLGQYVLRYIFRMVDFVLTLGVGAIFAVSLTENKQRIGDIVAGTTLVKTRARTGSDELGYIELEEEYEPVFREVLILKDRDIALINEVIQNFHKTGNLKLLDNMGVKVREHLEVELPEKMTMYKFLDTVLKDYSYLTTHGDYNLS